MEFYEGESPTRKTPNQRSLAFRAPAVFSHGGVLILPEDNSVDGVLSKIGDQLAWGTAGLTEEQIQALIDASLADYQPLSEKDQANGYPSLDANTRVPAAELGSGTPTSAKFLDGSQAWRILADADIPSSIARDSEVTAALAAYQLLSGKDAANGYPSLDSGTLVPAAELGSGTPTSAKFLDGSRAWRVLVDGDIPAAIARDSEVTSAISTHEAASDPHTGYQKESEKDQANGYAGLNGSTLVPAAKLGTNSGSATKFLDGTNVFRLLVAGDIPAIFTFTYISSPWVDVSASGATTTIDLATGTNFKVSLAASTTLTLSNPVDGAKYLFYFKQDATGGRTVTWPGTVKWRSGLAPVITPAANAIDVVSMVYHSGDTIFLAEYAQDYS